MSIQMNVAEAKAKLSELITRAEAGEEVIIARDGKPAVVLAPRVMGTPARRRLGVWDQFGASIPENLFLEPDKDVEMAVRLWDAAPFDQGT